MGLGLLLAGLVAELVLRARGALAIQRSPLSGFHDPDPWLGWRGVPELEGRFQTEEFDVLIEHGPDGFRRSEPPNPERASTRIALLGDSFQWGGGVGQGETLADQLRVLGSGSWWVKNYGVSAFGTGQQSLLLESDVLPADPTRVVLAYFMNDLVDSAHEKTGQRPWFRIEGGELALENSPVAESVLDLGRSIERQSVAWTQLEAALRRFRKRNRALAAPDEYGLFERVPTADPEQLWLVQELLLVRMRDACSAAGVPFEVVYVPAGTEFADPDSGEGVAERLLGLCSELQIPCFDLRPGLRAVWAASDEREARGGPLYYERDCHWTAAGHRAAAELLGAHLEQTAD